ncbi:hypothetical protein F442_08545 [Phytophthora nicotianae P10297]|uniref:Uncharacterized protein n=1 Tax=Phytophthora nicotianae P10297 TaxID=1317064 RepID=W2ZFI6_PHYNI|nr:hypothetical protein F442_08545 [Phytophthora nicotianae P10297]
MSEEGGNEQVDAGASGGRVQCADWQDGKRATAGRQKGGGWLAEGRRRDGKRAEAEKGGRMDGGREGVSGAARRPRTSGTGRSIVKAD